MTGLSCKKMNSYGLIDERTHAGVAVTSAPNVECVTETIVP